MSSGEVLKKLSLTSPSCSWVFPKGVYKPDRMNKIPPVHSQLNIPDRTSMERQPIIYLSLPHFAVVLSLWAIPCSLHWKRGSLSLFQPNSLCHNRCWQNLVKATLEQQQLNKGSQTLSTSPHHNIQICIQLSFCRGDRCLLYLFTFCNPDVSSSNIKDHL